MVYYNIIFKGAKMITQAELKEQLHYDEETGIFTRKVSNSRRVKVGQVAGSLTYNGYIEICVNGKRFLAHRLAWFYMYGVWPVNQIDHEDRIRHHNWKSNLRDLTQSQNNQNTGIPRSNTSGFKGVHFSKTYSKWVAQIKLHGKHTFLGHYDTPELASEAYKQAQEKLHTHRPLTVDLPLTKDAQEARRRRVNTTGYTSEYKGVNYHKAEKRWVARISVQGKRIHLGYFSTPELAHEAYLAAQAIHHPFRPSVSDLL